MGRRSRCKQEKRAARRATRAAVATARSVALERFERATGRRVAGTAVTDPGTEKLSDTLVDFAQPLLESAGPLDARSLDTALSVATVVWNAYLLGEDGRERLKALREQMVAAGVEAGYAERLIGSLVTRRERLFGDDRRLAGSVAVVEGPEKLHVTATYVAPSPTTLK